MIKQDDVNQLDYTKMSVAFGILRAINNKPRQEILKLILDHKRICVTDIYIRLRIEQSVASQQLKILREGNLVIAERVGIQIFYSLNVKHISKVVVLIEQLRKTA